MCCDKFIFKDKEEEDIVDLYLKMELVNGDDKDDEDETESQGGIVFYDDRVDDLEDDDDLTDMDEIPDMEI